MTIAHHGYISQQETTMELSEGDRIKLSVKHRITIRFDEPVTDPVLDLRLSPIDTGLQRVWEHSITTNPECRHESYRDLFGNRVVKLQQLPEGADKLGIEANSIVETTNSISCGPESPPDPRPYQERWQEFLNFSAGVPELAEYGNFSIPAEISMYMDDIEFGHNLYLMARHFHSSFSYDSDSQDSSPKQLFEQGSGNSQAMAHAMIGVLRHMGIPARFASGYLFDSGVDEIYGAASPHAWVQAWHEGYGWIGIDPTNAKLVGWEYVRTAIGRDYLDVLPCDCPEGVTASMSVEVALQDPA